MVLLGTVGAYIFHRIIPSAPLLGLPENAIGNVVTPVQNFFSGLTETFTGYFRSLKLRANLENEYNALRAENEQLVYKAMLADELQIVTALKLEGSCLGQAVSRHTAIYDHTQTSPEIM